MKKEYPMEFSLENGTKVVVNKTGIKTYDFSLTPDDGVISHYTFTDDESFTKEVEDSLEFDQLDAIRRFWLLQQTDDYA